MSVADNVVLPCIKVTKNAKVRLKTNHILRKLSELYLKEKQFAKMEIQSVSYGKRWIVETVFSYIKRMFREYVYSVKFKNMKQEMMLKVSLYNKMISI
jgi:hypothetical protein